MTANLVFDEWEPSSTITQPPLTTLGRQAPPPYCIRRQVVVKHPPPRSFDGFQSSSMADSRVLSGTWPSSHARSRCSMDAGHHSCRGTFSGLVPSSTASGCAFWPRVAKHLSSPHFVARCDVEPDWGLRASGLCLWYGKLGRSGRKRATTVISSMLVGNLDTFDPRS